MNRSLLEAPFDRTQIKQREGAFGDQLDYLEGATVIQRLNDALESEWTFEVVDHQIHEQEVFVLGKLSQNGIVKMQFGKSAITRSRATNAVVSLGDDLKAAATDALKKCATLFGVGLHLYFDVPAPTPGNGATAKSSSPQPSAADNGHGRISARQLSAIFGIAACGCFCSGRRTSTHSRRLAESWMPSGRALAIRRRIRSWNEPS